MGKPYSDIDWTSGEKKFLGGFSTPWSVQEYLDSISYNPDYECRSPRHVMIRKKAHCFEGALFAAAVFDFLGFKPLIVDMKAWNDDDHVIAVFRADGHWGAVAKSNFTTLRFREPVYRSLRELIMSYFDFYFNVNGEKTLRSYSIPFNLTAFNSRNWATTDEDLEYIGDKIESLHHYPVMNEKMIRNLNNASRQLISSGLLGSDEKGLFRPQN